MMVRRGRGWLTTSMLAVLLVLGMGGCPLGMGALLLGGALLLPCVDDLANIDGTADGGTTDDGTTDDGTTDDGTTDDGTTDDGTTTDTATAGLTIVKTNIALRHDADLECGDDLIAFGTDTIVGVSYIVPSLAPTAGTPVPDNDLYSSKAFSVGGDTIFLVGSNAVPTASGGSETGPLMFQVSVFDVPTAAITHTFPATDLRLANIPVGTDSAGHIRADGDYCAVRCDQNEVTDGKVLKVIDVSGAAPALIAFDVNPAETGFALEQVDVDAATKTVVAVADDTFFIYNIDTPTAAPVQIAAPDGIGDTQIEISGNYIIAADDQGYERAILVDIAGQTTIALTEGFVSGTKSIGIGNAVFAFFADADAIDSGQRAAVGTAPGPGYTKAALDNQIDGSTNNNGLVGFAGDLCIVPDGSYIFMSGAYLQYSPGTAVFTVPVDPEGIDPYACPAWDIDCSSNTVGFKTAHSYAGDAESVGYIILP